MAECVQRIKARLIAARIMLPQSEQPIAKMTNSSLPRDCCLADQQKVNIDEPAVI
eukprot:COSAG02_NODE_1279_length_13487_cov_7.611696_1_plen_54_part_10